MNIDLRRPNINARTEAERLSQLQSYLFQLIEQLEWAFNNIEAKKAEASTAAEALSTASTSTANAANTFNAIKSLIIKSSDIVNAYYEEINARLEGIYVAQSEFGTYSEQTSQSIEQNSTSIEQAFTNLQEISSTLEEIKSTVLDVSAYIKSGLLEYDEEGLPVYGLEIGQKNTVDGEEVFDKYARFSANRLSFFDQNDVEVAYISDYILHITNAEITGTLTLGGYEVDTSDGLVFNWTGGV